MTFTNLFDSLKAGKYTIIPVSEKLAQSEIEKVFVGTDKTALSMVDQRLNVVEVTSKYGSYVKFAVKCEDEPQPTSSSVVLSIYFLPDPLIGEDNHYKCFSDVYGSTTTERDCPSSQSKAKKLLSFSSSKQHVLNVDTMVQCKECNMWRLLFSQKKLSVRDKKQLQDILADIAYTCGATLEELDLPDNLKSVVVRVHNCYDPVEKLYYSAD